MKATGQAVRLAFVSALGRTPAFLVPVLIAAMFGSGAHTDAYFIAYSAVLLFGGTLGQGLEQAIVPFAARALQGPSGIRYLDRAARRSALIGLGGWIVALPVLVRLAAPALRAEVVSYAICFTPLTLAWCAAAAFSGALISRWQIARATGSMLLRGAGAVVGLALSPMGGGLWSAALGLGAGEVCRAWWMRRAIVRDVGINPGEPEPLPGLGRAASAQVGASAAIGAAPLAERLLAMVLGVGAVSHLEYAMRLFSVASVPFDGALVPLALAQWSNHVTTTTAPPPRRDVLRVVGEGVAVAVAIAAVIVIFAPTIVRWVLGHGRFSAADTLVVSRLVRALALAYVPNMGASLLERHYIALKRNRALASLSVGRAGVRLGTDWLLLSRLGLLAFPIGFAVSESLYLATLLALMTPTRRVAALEA